MFYPCKNPHHLRTKMRNENNFNTNVTQAKKLSNKDQKVVRTNSKKLYCYIALKLKKIENKKSMSHSSLEFALAFVPLSLRSIVRLSNSHILTLSSTHILTLSNSHIITLSVTHKPPMVHHYALPTHAMSPPSPCQTPPPPPTFPHSNPLFFFSHVFGIWEGEEGGLLGIWPFLLRFLVFWFLVFFKGKNSGEGWDDGLTITIRPSFVY